MHRSSQTGVIVLRSVGGGTISIGDVALRALEIVADNEGHLERVEDGGQVMNVATVAALFLVAPLLAQPEKQPVDCTFTHPHYAGSCVEKVTPAENQTPVQACRVILDCLNNTRCAKTYCRATTIRGGWTLVSPKPKDR